MGAFKDEHGFSPNAERPTTNVILGLIMPIPCTEYRESLQLLALKKRLAEEKITPEERKELEELIRKLEKKLGL
jgi:hypothetical protein